jgi:hypothetical protein
MWVSAARPVNSRELSANARANEATAWLQECLMNNRGRRSERTRKQWCASECVRRLENSLREQVERITQLPRRNDVD